MLSANRRGATHFIRPIFSIAGAAVALGLLIGVVHQATVGADERPVLRVGSGSSAPVSEVILMGWEGRSGDVTILDADSGDSRVSIAVGYNHLVIQRRSTNELIVTDFLVGDQGSGVQARLMIFQADSDRPRATFELPERMGYATLPGSWMALSGDEQYLFYLVGGALPSNECEGYGNEYGCNAARIAILDLDAPHEPARLVQLAPGCNSASLHPDSGSSILATCQQQRVAAFYVDADGAITNSVEVATDQLPPREHRAFAGSAATAKTGFPLEDGGTLLVLRNGSIVVMGVDGEVRTRERLLGGTASLSGDPVVRDGRLFIPYSRVYHENAIIGLIVFDLANRSVRDIAVPESDYYTVLQDRILVSHGVDLTAVSLIDGKRDSVGWSLPDRLGSAILP